MTSSLLRRAALTLLLTAAGPALAVEPLKMGFVCPFTGSSADFGLSARLGAELAVKEINEVGGFLGRPLEMIARDDEGTPEKGLAAAEAFVVKDKVAFTIGYCNTGVAMASLDVFQKHKHLLMVPVATGTMITQKYPPEQSYIFRMSPKDSLQAAFLIEDLVRRGVSKVAVMADTTGYGAGGFSDLMRFLALQTHYVTPVYTARFAPGVKSLTKEVNEAKAAGAEAIIVYTVGPEMAVLTKARAEARFSGQIMGPWPMSLATVWQQSGGAAEGALAVQSIIRDTSNERRTSFIARLSKLAGNKPVGSLMAAAQTYDAVHMMLRALFQAKGDTSGGALKAALEDLQKPYAGVVTTHVKPFAADDHDAFSINMVWLGVWKRGEIQFAYAEDLAKSSVIRRKEREK